MSSIVRKSPLPRYYQLKEIMREKIGSGEWKPGDLIPSERELGEQYGISRMTARQAITELVNEGLFLPRTGQGYFCQPPQNYSAVDQSDWFYGGYAGARPASWLQSYFGPDDSRR